MGSEHGCSTNIESVVSAEWLVKQLGRDDLVIADCRFELADPEAGRKAYDRDHIPGAVFFDLDQDLSDPVRAHTDATLSQSVGISGGRHPLPSIDRLAALFGAAGIGDGVTVVCYDDQMGSMAARLWWILRYLGHERVALLDGGYAAWAGNPITSERSAPVARRFVPRVQSHMLASMDEVRELVTAGKGTIVDSRAPERYRGEVEPLDPVAGHIPGAVNMPWNGNVDPTGMLYGANDLAQRFARFLDAAKSPTPAVSEPIVVHCGSGVTGCLNVLAMERAGVHGVKLYVGGWSEWCSYENNPVETGEGR